MEAVGVFHYRDLSTVPAQTQGNWDKTNTRRTEQTLAVDGWKMDGYFFCFVLFYVQQVAFLMLNLLHSSCTNLS